MVLFFVYIVFYVDPAFGLPNTINVCVCVYTCIQKERVCLDFYAIILDN